MGKFRRVQLIFSLRDTKVMGSKSLGGASIRRLSSRAFVASVLPRVRSLSSRAFGGLRRACQL